MASGLRLRKGDEVVVIAGKDRGKRGRVQEVHPRERTVIVAGVNISKRHTKPNPTKNQKGGIVEQPRPLSIGKVMVVCPHCGQPTRVAHRIEDAVKERVCKNCGEAIVVEEST
ncbi:MAG: 50S ribosomal protein L24 [Chloroflexi bacterium]|nr:MAG: 50S ribosomal protein L24 [Chloroflexi bacterium 13_1_40CM_2_70_6]OLE77648.1 MAG: 50S ribosomal protein L24 [Chloroflexi bacterium 13_1_20CM_2_70_9]TME97920.1 MAG: 50S ribosomal protein L24 [Chloroflexota bacterium]TMF68224.1 MAG: 50S ribosomal protein L24 [Chloroflexota bacterium]TMG33052.1 MAG: 50S ribosomal protein L24 [Chloroflexota bacterium]